MKYLYTLLLFVLLLPTGLTAAKPVYTRAQVDSIVAAEVSRQVSAEVARQLAAEQIDLKIERSANEKYALGLAEQDNRLTEHDHEMSSRYTWIGLLFTLAVGFFGVAVPYMTNKRYEQKLDMIAAENKGELETIAKANEKKIGDAVDAKTKRLNQRIKELDEKIRAHDKQMQVSVDEAKASQNAADEAANKAKVSELFSQALSEKDLDKKIELLSKAIGLDSENEYLYRERGWAYEDKDDHEKAIADNTKAIEINPRYKEAYNDRGYSYNIIGEYDKAIEDFNKAIELASYFSNPYCHRGKSYRMKGDYDKAIKDYSKAIELKPDYGRAYFERGLAYKAKGGKEKAAADFKKAEKLGYKP